MSRMICIFYSNLLLLGAKKMKIEMKRFVVCLIFACFLWVAKAQKIEDCFVRMPNELIEHLEEAWRKDLVDIYKAGKPAVLENILLGKSVLRELTEHYLLLQSTERSVVELKLLPLVNNTYIICMIETVYAPVADSRVSFYTTEWQQLPAEDIFTPVAETWFWKEEADQSSQEDLSRLGIFLVKYHLSAENANLTAEYMTPHTLDEESQQVVRPLLKPGPKTYEWKSGRFE